MVAAQVVLITAVAMVDAASMLDGAGRRLCQDEHDPDPSCAVNKFKNLSEETECNFVVTRTTLRVEKPLIRDANVGADCNVTQHGVVQHRICSECGKEHNPCNSTFTSCRGCCGSPSSHVPLREQSCRLIKGYFSREEARETCKVELRPQKIGEAWQEPDVVEDVFGLDPDTLHKQLLVASCDVSLNQHDCPRVPALVSMECNQCNKGSPLLLKKCCDECVRFAKSSKLANLTSILPFVVCNGCDTNVIFWPSHDKKKAAIETNPATKYWESWVAKGGKTMPWFAAGGYQSYSETAAQADMDRWIEIKICNAFELETCGADHEYPRDRRLLHSGGDHDQNNFSYEQCRQLQEVQASTATTTTSRSLRLNLTQHGETHQRIISMPAKTSKTTTLKNKTDADELADPPSSSFARRVSVTLIIVAGLVV